MAVRKNPDWHVWLGDLWYSVSHPPQVYFVVAGLFAIALIGIFNPFARTPSSTATTAPSQAVQVAPPFSPVKTIPKCGGVYEQLEITPTKQLINAGADCNSAWEVKWGTVRFTTDTGKLIDVAAGQPLLDHTSRLIAWQSLGTSNAIVHAAFCPRGTNWNGERCG